MQENEIPAWLPFLFPVAFIGLWLLVTRLLSAMSGWDTLQDRYPDRADPPLLALRFQSGTMGRGVNYGNCLTLTATRIGLRVATWRIFGLFSSPFLVPWSEIRAEPGRMLFMHTVRLRFGNPEQGQLTLRRGTWERLLEASPSADASLKRRA